MGGAGGGLVYNVEELKTVCARGLQASLVGQVLVEESIIGWEELELEVVRDAKGNMITVCFIENIDPMGVHTGDSFCSAPMLTISEEVQKRLQEQAYRIVNEVQVIGGTNVQFAHDPVSDRIIVIEINPRTSRSSALASKATGYPIAKVAAKIALGYTLDEIKNAITGKTYASFEPALDYCVVKFPRLPFDKFITAKRTLTTQMKATGEVMSICTNFEGAMMKAIRSLEQHVDCLTSYDFSELDDDELMDRLKVVDDQRIWVIAEALRRGLSHEEIHDITMIDLWFIDKIHSLVKMELKLLRLGEKSTIARHKVSEENVSEYEEAKKIINFDTLLKAKKLEYPDKVISRLTRFSVDTIKALREFYGIKAAYKLVDTCAAEFEAETRYYY
jgi:carbamoyl-phosphate synthase large subunit